MSTSAAITRALADSRRSYSAAKASTVDVGGLYSQMPSAGAFGRQADMSRAAEQMRHFTGWVYASIRPIAQRIAGQPIHVGRVKRGPRSQKMVNAEPFDSHELLTLLADPNDLMVAWSLVFTTVASLELTGRSLWWLPKKKQILPIPTAWISGFEGTTKILAFTVRPPYTGEAFSIPADECVYFSYPHPGDPHGVVSPLQAAASAVDADESITTSQASMFRRGIHPSHAIIVGKEPMGDGQAFRPRLTPAQERQIIGAIRKRYSDVHQHGEPIILDGLIEDVKRLSNTPSEMDWLGSGKATKARISQIFGTNPIIMGELEGANRASSLAADKHFCDFTINPKIELLSQTLTEWMRPMFGQDIVVWIEPCVPNDAEMALKWAETLAKHGVILANELRQMAGLPASDEFAGTLVGGKNMTTTNLIESAIREMVMNSMAEIESDRLLSAFERRSIPSPNGNGADH